VLGNLEFDSDQESDGEIANIKEIGTPKEFHFLRQPNLLGLIRARFIVKAWFAQVRRQTGTRDGRSGCPRGYCRK